MLTIVAFARNWNDPLTDAVIFNTMIKCYGRGTYDYRWISCPKNWGCDFDCFGAPICGTGEGEFLLSGTEKCGGAGRCQDKVILCPPITYCAFQKSGCPYCSPYI